VHEGTTRSQFGETSEAIFLNSGYVYTSAEQAEARFKGDEEGFVYSRYANPTVAMFEARMCALEGAEAARGTSSGMAAVAASLMCHLKAGDHVVSARALFGSCRYVVEDLLPRYGIATTLIDGNSAVSSSQGGNVSASNGLAVLNFSDHDPLLLTVSRTVISRNTATATSKTGSASVLGAGVFNNSLLALQNVTIVGNVGKASGPTGTLQGGGIWNGVDLSGPPVELSLDHTAVTHNQLTGSPGMTLQGGGIFTTEPVTLSHSTVAGNAPDQCVGC